MHQAASDLAQLEEAQQGSQRTSPATEEMVVGTAALPHEEKQATNGKKAEPEA